MKIIRIFIKSCNECICTNGFSDLRGLLFCNKLNKEVKANDIDPRCPLEDAEVKEER